MKVTPLKQGEIIGQIDVSNYILQKAQIEATIDNLKNKTNNPNLKFN